MDLPRRFFEWAYEGRAEMVRRMASGEKVPPEQLFLGFTRHCPVFVSNGPAGLNGAVKGVGFIPRDECLQETIEAYLAHIDLGWRDGYSQAGLELLAKHVWGPECAARLDFSLLGSLELAKRHTWDNLRENPAVTLCYFQPPGVSFEVRGTVEIHGEGPYHTLLNAQHDVYHRPSPERWPSRPAYLVRIKEIYDNSASREGFGARLL
ncbi:MAG: pyridoxamine 5'-phosphate oxidase family protein [Bacillota bacterium]|nr:pyridoxamine 5'-phosphate oxidase family protein [Bacillota bacterium]